MSNSVGGTSESQNSASFSSRSSWGRVEQLAPLPLPLPDPEPEAELKPLPLPLPLPDARAPLVLLFLVQLAAHRAADEAPRNGTYGFGGAYQCFCDGTGRHNKTIGREAPPYAGLPAPGPSTWVPQCRLAYVVLYGSLLAHLLTFPLTGYRAPRTYAACLFALYAGFLLLGCLAEAGTVGLDFLCGGAWPCPERPAQAQWYRTVAHANRNAARMAVAGAKRSAAHTLLVPSASAAAWATK